MSKSDEKDPKVDKNDPIQVPKGHIYRFLSLYIRALQALYRPHRALEVPIPLYLGGLRFPAPGKCRISPGAPARFWGKSGIRGGRATWRVFGDFAVFCSADRRRYMGYSQNLKKLKIAVLASRGFLAQVSRIGELLNTVLGVHFGVPGWFWCPSSFRCPRPIQALYSLYIAYMAYIQP